MEELTPLEIPVSKQTIRLIKSYANLVDEGTDEISRTLGGEISGVLERKLTELILNALGNKVQLKQEFQTTLNMNNSSGFAYARAIPNEELFASSLGDQQEPEDIPPVEELTLPKRGLTFADIDHDMEIEDPLKEAKAEPLDMASPTNNSDDILAEAIGYIDTRISKRKKRFGNGRAKVTALNDRILAEGAGV